MAEYLIKICIKSLRFFVCLCLLGYICVWFLKYNWNRRRFYKLSWTLNGPFALPVLGNALTFYGSMEELTTTFLSLAKIFESPSRYWLVNRLMVYISEPRDVEIIFNHKKSMNKSDFNDKFKPLMNNGLLAANGEIWRTHRKMLNPTFNQNVLNSFVAVFDKQNRSFVERMLKFAGKGKLDIYEYILRLNMDTLSENLMGIKTNAQDNKCDFIVWYMRGLNIACQRLVRPWYHVDVVFNLFPISKVFNEYVRKTRSFAYSVVMQKRKIHEENLKTMELKPDADIIITKRKALLEHMLEMSGTKFTDTELVDEVMTFLAAGAETTSSALSFILMMLGAHHEIQEKVYEELVDIFGNTDRSIVSEDLSKMKYLERVIKETLRLFPASLILVRTATDDLKLTTCTVPKDTILAIGSLALHRNQKFWADPLKFDPERFLPEAVQKRHPYTYIPFAAGPRNCIGHRYAMMSMKLFLATFLRTYLIKQDLLVKDIRLEVTPLLKPTKGFMIEMELRNGLK